MVFKITGFIDALTTISCFGRCLFMAKTKYKKGKRGYEAYVWDGTYNKDGTKHRKHLFSDKSSKDLERKVMELQQSISEGNVQLPTDISFVDYSWHWFKVKKGVREKNTQKMYRNVINKHFAPLDGLPLSDVKHSHIQGLINMNLQQPRSCEEIALTAKQVLKMAVADSFITQDQFIKITSDWAVPKYKAPEKRVLTDIEKEAIKTAAFSDRERVFVYILLYCGLRRGEALALTPFDFIFKSSGSSLTVNKTVIFDNNNPELKNQPKSDHGYRTVPIPEPAASFLKTYVSSVDGPYLFSNLKKGGLMTLTGYNILWKSIVRKMNVAAGGSDSFPKVTGLTAHIFRHNYCTNLCYQVPQISIRKIASLLGDTDKMVLNVYNHIMEDKEDVLGAVTEALAL